MTSERTPQDVLREALHSEFWGLELEHSPNGEHSCGDMEEASARRISDRLATDGYEVRRLDKAIAEAPDMQETRDWLARIQTEYPAPPSSAMCVHIHCRERRAADPLSEKPGLDVERLARAVHNVEGGTFKTATCYHDPTTGEPVDCKWTAELLAAEYASTDNEGR